MKNRPEKARNVLWELRDFLGEKHYLPLAPSPTSTVFSSVSKAVLSLVLQSWGAENVKISDDISSEDYGTFVGAHRWPVRIRLDYGGKKDVWVGEKPIAVDLNDFKAKLINGSIYKPNRFSASFPLQRIFVGDKNLAYRAEDVTKKSFVQTPDVEPPFTDRRIRFAEFTSPQSLVVFEKQIAEEMPPKLRSAIKRLTGISIPKKVVTDVEQGKFKKWLTRYIEAQNKLVKGQGEIHRVTTWWQKGIARNAIGREARPGIRILIEWENDQGEPYAGEFVAHPLQYISAYTTRTCTRNTDEITPALAVLNSSRKFFPVSGDTNKPSKEDLFHNISDIKRWMDLKAHVDDDDDEYFEEEDEFEAFASSVYVQGGEIIYG